MLVGSYGRYAQGTKPPSLSIRLSNPADCWFKVSSSQVLQSHRIESSVEAVIDLHAQRVQQLETQFKLNNASSLTLPDYTALLLEEYSELAAQETCTTCVHHECGLTGTSEGQYYQ
jgi:hypothetical protein